MRHITTRHPNYCSLICQSLLLGTTNESWCTWTDGDEGKLKAYSNQSKGTEVGKVVTLRDLYNIHSTGTNMNSLILIINSLKRDILFFREMKVCEKFWRNGGRCQKDVRLSYWTVDRQWW